MDATDDAREPDSFEADALSPDDPDPLESAPPPPSLPEPEPMPPETTQAPSAFGGSRWLALLLLLAAAAGVRAWHLFEPPIEFHPSRQYRSALMARSYAARENPELAEAERAIAEVALDRNRPLEPPLLERGTALAWNELGDSSGADSLWVPRGASALAWLLGGLCLFALARRLTSFDGAFVATAVFWLSPFAVPASRSFQPDPTMIALVVASWLFIEGFTRRPSVLRLIPAVALGAAAILVKPVAIFPVMAAVKGLRAREVSWRGLFTDGWTWAFGLLAVAPAAWYYVDGLFLSGFLENQASGSFKPELLGEERFWLGWKNMALGVVGSLLPALAFVGAFAFREVRARALVRWLALSYLVFGLVFTHHIHTHNYYSLILVPIVALAIAPLGEVLGDRLRRGMGPAAAPLAAWTLALALGAWAVYLAPWRAQRPDPGFVMTVYDRVAELTDGESDTVLLARDQGKGLQFHAGISGVAWPRSWEREGRLREGEAPADVATEIEKLGEPSLFIVTDKRELDDQSDLAAYLAGFEVVADERIVSIWNLRAPIVTGSDPTGSEPTDSTPADPTPAGDRSEADAAEIGEGAEPTGAETDG